jgi:hypothetical protein
MRTSRWCSVSAAISSRQTGCDDGSPSMRSHALAQAELVLGMEGGAAAGALAGSRRRPSSSSTSSAPVDEPMNTLMPAHRAAAPARRHPGVLAGAADPEGEVAMHAMMAAPTLSASVPRRGQRIGVGHLEHGGDAAQHGRARTGLQIFLVLEARLAEMHLAVDHAGQDVQARQSITRRPRPAEQIADGGDAAIGHADVAHPSPS